MTEQEDQIHDSVALGAVGFWSRRFHIGLALGNGAGFVSILSAVSQTEHFRELAPLVEAPLAVFLIGLIASGLIPALQSMRFGALAAAEASGRTRPSPLVATLRVAVLGLSLTSAVSFVAGAILIVSGLERLSGAPATSMSRQGAIYVECREGAPQPADGAPCEAEGYWLNADAE